MKFATKTLDKQWELCYNVHYRNLCSFDGLAQGALTGDERNIFYENKPRKQKIRSRCYHGHFHGRGHAVFGHLGKCFDLDGRHGGIPVGLHEQRGRDRDHPPHAE